MTSAHAAADAATIDIAAVQAALAADGLDAWLLYDFRGINPIAADVTAVARQGGHLATRRWYYLIPVSGEPRALVHAIERHSLAHLPGTTDRYAGRDQLESGLRRLLTGVRRVAMEYSPNCAIPYVSRVDAGTIELVRSAGVEVVSSGDLVQRFAAVWDDAAIASHREASEKLYRVKDRAFDGHRAADARRRGHDRVRHPAADGGLVPRTKGSSAIPTRTYRRSRTRATRTICRRRAPRARSAATSSSCSISGASWIGPARCLLTSPGWDLPAARCPNGTRRRSRRSRPRAMPPSRWSSARPPAGRNCAAGRSIAPPRRCCRARATAITSCTGPGTASASRFTATA